MCVCTYVPFMCMCICVCVCVCVCISSFLFPQPLRHLRVSCKHYGPTAFSSLHVSPKNKDLLHRHNYHIKKLNINTTLLANVQFIFKCEYECSQLSNSIFESQGWDSLWCWLPHLCSPLWSRTVPQPFSSLMVSVFLKSLDDFFPPNKLLHWSIKCINKNVQVVNVHLKNYHEMDTSTH